MGKVILLIAMLYAHIVDDYRHQGILAQMKQKSWWEENAPDDMYRNDYIVALFEHAFSWTVAIHIPAVIYLYLTSGSMDVVEFGFLFFAMWMFHALADHAKANLHAINLVGDQLIHIVQVVGVWIIYITL